MAGKKRIGGASEEAEKAEFASAPAGRASETDTSVEGGGSWSKGGWGERALWERGVRLYVLVVGVVGAATALRWILDPLFGEAKQFLVYYPAIAVAALVGGGRAGVMATVLSALAVDVFFQEPRGSLGVVGLSDWVALGLFAIGGGLMSWMAERVGRARRQRVEEELRESEERYHSLFEHMLEGFAYCRLIYENGAPSDLLYLGVNEAFERLTGLKGVVGKKVSEVIPGIHQSNPELLQTYGRVVASGQPEKFETYVESLGIWFSISVFSPQKEHFVAVFDNITKRKQAEANQALLGDVLHILNRGGELHAVAREALGLLRERAGFDAVGLRLRQGEDCPYFEQSGFSQEFVREENFLCAKGPGAAILRDAQGQPRLECTCGLVLSGRTDPKKSCFSLGGSFWTNRSSELLALPSQDDPRNNPRNRCIHCGYQSVGLFPVRAGREIVGLLQLNDRRPGRFTPELLGFYESLAQNIGLALKRAAAEEAQRASEARFRRVFTNDMVPMAIWAKNGAIEEANDALLELVGYTRADLEAGRLSWDALTPAEYRQRDLEAVAEVGARGFCTPYEKCYRHKDGHLIPIVVGGRGYDEQSGRSVLFAVDITERKRAEEALRESEAQLRSAALAGNIGLWSWKPGASQAVVSANWRSLFGVGADAVVTFETWRDTVHPEDRERVVRELKETLEQRRGFNTEYRVVRPDGTVRWIVGRGHAWYDERCGATGMAGVAVDITEQKEAQQVLARGKEELERLVAERTEKLQELVGELEHFSYTITHDLKSPLRAMKGFAEIATVRCGECARKEAKEALGKISSAAERMEGLITDALNYSRSVRQELPLTDVDTGALLRGMLDSYPELQPSRAHVRVEGELPVVLGNEAGLTQCLSNLLGNGVKFVRSGERPQIRVWAEEREGWARIWVEDEGIGISKEMLPRVFEMFSRGGGGYEGTGIGLALVRKVTQRMGGRAGVESEEGKGSRFWIELKLGEARAKPRRVEMAAGEPKGGMVLYVEDEESDATFMRMAFAEQGLESALRVVGDGRAAIEYLSGAGKYADRKESPLPTVVLLDLNLPQVPGFEVLKWMRNHPDFVRTPVVVFSSSTREDDRVKALELGANEFVGKPNSGLKFGEVVEALKGRWLGRV